MVRVCGACAAKPNDWAWRASPQLFFRHPGSASRRAGPLRVDADDLWHPTKIRQAGGSAAGVPHEGHRLRLRAVFRTKRPERSRCCAPRLAYDSVAAACSAVTCWSISWGNGSAKCVLAARGSAGVRRASAPRAGARGAGLRGLLLQLRALCSRYRVELDAGVSGGGIGAGRAACRPTWSGMAALPTT
jgi:hypothetical protein